MTEIGNFLLGFAFNFLIAFIIVKFIYYPSTHNKSYVFTFLAFNSIIFFVLSFMASIEIGMGVGFGLFAIFSILRYRTDPIPIREMTYLFIISALPLMNVAAVDGTLWPQIIFANLALLVVLGVLEREWGFTYEASKQIIYEKIELVHPDFHQQLILDLEERTGLKIKRVIIGKIDFLHDIANLKIFYDDPHQGGWLDNADPITVLVDKNEGNV